MAQVTVTREFSVFGAVLGDCVVVASYDADDWREYFDNNEEGKCPDCTIDSATLNGVEIDSTHCKLFLRTDLDTFEHLVKTSYFTESMAVLRRHGLEKLGEDIFTAIETALESYVSTYDAVELV